MANEPMKPLPNGGAPKPPVYKRKTFWAGLIVVFAGAVAAAFDGWATGGAKIMEGLQIIFGSMQ